jgi:hypothetical protein
VREEAQRLNKIHEGRNFRLRLVDFAGGGGMPEIRTLRARASAKEASRLAAAQAVASAVNVSQRVVLRARVILAAD